MFYIYREKENLFVNTQDGIVWVQEEDEATKMTNSQATNLLKKLQEQFPDAKKVTTTKTLSEEEVMEKFARLQEVVKEMSELSKDIPAMQNFFSKEQRETDLAKEDILHRIELTPVGNFMYVVLGRKLKKILQRRRIMKDALHYLQCLTNQDKIEKLAQAYFKYAEAMENRTYSPRKMPEIFE